MTTGGSCFARSERSVRTDEVNAAITCCVDERIAEKDTESNGLTCRKNASSDTSKPTTGWIKMLVFFSRMCSVA